MTTRTVLARLIHFLTQPLFATRSRGAGHAGGPGGAGDFGRSTGFGGSTGFGCDTAASRVTVPASLMRTAPAPLAGGESILPAAPPAGTQAMRTLEEVRGDLARLREQTARRREAARRAHLAHVMALREDAAALAVAPAASRQPPPRRSASPSGFMPTDFLDIPGSPAA